MRSLLLVVLLLLGQSNASRNFATTGSSDALNLGQPANLANVAAQGGGGLTYSIWIKLTTLTSSSDQRLIIKGADSNGFAIGGGSPGDGSVYYFHAASVTALVRSSAASVMTTGTWIHLLLTWTGSLTATTVKIYKNGSEVSYGGLNVDGIGTLTSDTTLDQMLGNNTNLNRSTSADLAFFGAWNRVLTADEIAALAAGFEPACIPNGLVSYTPLIGNLTDTVNGVITANGTTITDSPRIIRCGGSGQ